MNNLNGRDVKANWASPRVRIKKEDCFFYHTIDLSDGTTVEGHWDLRGKFSDYIGNVDLKDARVLDVGAASGFLSFSAEAAGAREVVSFDLDSAERQHLLPFHDSLYMTDYQAWVNSQSKAFNTWKNAYWFTHRDLGSRARAIYGDVYSLPGGIGQFDVVILGAILEHLGDPVRAIGSIASVSSKHIVINTDILPGDQPVARFNGDPAHPERSYIFWTYTVETYRRILLICGFEIESVKVDTYRAFSPLAPDNGWVQTPRTSIVARKIS